MMNDGKSIRCNRVASAAIQKILRSAFEIADQRSSNSAKQVRDEYERERNDNALVFRQLIEPDTATIHPPIKPTHQLAKKPISETIMRGGQPKSA